MNGKSKKPSRWWYLLAIFLGPIGGIVGYFVLKDRDRKFAEKLLIVGLVMIAVWWVLSIILSFIAYTYISGVFTTKTASLIEITDVNCTGNGVINAVVRNDGTNAITISKIKFYIQSSEMFPSSCSGNSDFFTTIEPGLATTCQWHTGLNGNVNLRIVGPSNTVSSTVTC